MIELLHLIQAPCGGGHKVVHGLQALPGVGVFRANFLRQGLPQHVQGGIDFALAPLRQQRAKNCPNVFWRAEVVTSIIGHVVQPHQLPRLQLFDAHTHVGARKPKCRHHVIGGQWPG